MSRIEHKHRREALTQKRRFSFISAALVGVIVVGVYFVYHATHAATATIIEGFKVIDDAGQSAPNPPGGATVNYICCNASIPDDSSNPFHFNSLPAGDHRIGIYNVPSGFTLKAITCLNNGCVGGNDQYTVGHGTFNCQPGGICDSNYGNSVVVNTTLAEGNTVDLRFIFHQNPPPAPPPPQVTLLANSSYGPISLYTNSSLTLAWSATNSPSSCTAAGYPSFNRGVGSSGSEDHSGDTNAPRTINYTLSCYNGGGSSTRTVTVNVVARPAPPGPGPQPPAPQPTGPGPQPPAPTPGQPAPTPGQPAPSPTPGHPAPSPTPGHPAPSPATPATPDKEAPSAPSEFTAKIDDVTVLLSWTAATDNVGVAKYQVERSLDNTNWDVLTDGLSDTQYRDRATNFSVHYYYRVKAIDAAGNAGPYANVDVQTSDFQSNAQGSGATTVTSDDGRATAIIPTGALDGDAQCSLSSGQDQSASKLVGKQQLLVGPYSLDCKLSSGDSVTTYKQPVNITLSLTADQFKKYDHLQAYSVDSDQGKATKLKSKIDTKARTAALTTTNPGEFLVAGSVKKNYWPLILSILIPTIILFGGAIVYRLRQIQSAQYKDYIRRKYYNL